MILRKRLGIIVQYKINFAPTLNYLIERLNAINGMNGAQYLACALPTTAKKLFY